MSKQTVNGVQLPDLEIGDNYTVGGHKVVVRLADETGCKRCVLETKCARFAVRSKLGDYYRLCGGYYREDCKSIVFMDYKQSE